MKEYEVTVIETIRRKVCYTVVADSKKEAETKARDGETEAEELLVEIEVSDREVVGTCEIDDNDNDNDDSNNKKLMVEVDWDFTTDEDPHGLEPHADVPRVVDVPSSVLDGEDYDEDNGNQAERISDYLSNLAGWCVNGFAVVDYQHNPQCKCGQE